MKKNEAGWRGRDQFCGRVFSDDLTAKVNLERNFKEIGECAGQFWKLERRATWLERSKPGKVVGDEDRAWPGGRRNIGVTDDVTRVRTSAESLPPSDWDGKLVEETSIACGTNPFSARSHLYVPALFSSCVNRGYYRLPFTQR